MLYVAYIYSVDGFAAHLRLRYSPGTVRHYLSDVEQYRREYGDSLSNETIRAWRSGITGSPATRNRKVAAIRSWARYRRQRVQIPMFRSHPRPRVIGNVEAVHEFSGREGLYLRLLAMTGMRASEALGLCGEDVKGGAVMVTGKGSKQRYVPLPADLQAEIAALGPGPLFPFSYSTIRRRAQSAGFRLHDLRHQFATDMLENGANILAIAKILGHSSVKTTGIYARPSLEMLQRNRELLGR